METKALIANGSEKERKNIARSLNEIGVRDIVVANDGMQALELLKTGKFDMVFAEFNTKFGKNEELVDAVRKIDGNLPIIVTAPKSKKIDELKKAYPKASNYLNLPFTTDELRKTVGQYVQSLAV